MNPMAGLRRLLHHFLTDSLFRNATFLMASTGIMSVLGFGFWIFVAHLYSTTDIGVASAVIAISLLISNLSTLGLNMGLIRFIPESKTPSRDINAAIITVGAATMLASAIYVLISPSLGSHLSFFSDNVLHGVLFCVLLTAVTLNSLTDSVFIARRKAHYHTVAYAVFGLVRLILPLFLLPFGALGIFMAYVAAAMVSLGLSLYFMARNCGYEPLSRPNFQVLTRTRRFAADNYGAILLAGLPSQLMPSIVVTYLGASQSAYFSMAWTMVNLLYIVPTSIAQSLLAEGSNDYTNRGQDLWQAGRLLALIVVPLVILSVLIAPILLHLFGPDYSKGSTIIFQILAASTVFVSINSLGTAVLNIERRTSVVFSIQVLTTGVTLSGAYLMLPYGLTGIGLAFLAGSAASSIVHVTVHIASRRHTA